MSETFLSGDRYFENYKKYYATGEFKLAKTNFLKAVDQFQRSDDICNLSALYISKFLIENDNKSLDFAKRYALMGYCQNEINSIDFLVGGAFKYDQLPRSLKIQSTEFKSVDELLKQLKSKELDDFSRSRLGRIFVQKLIEKKIAVDADKIINFTLDIDRFNGWTYFLKEDLILKKRVCELKKDECKYIDERLDIIQMKLNKN
ncbi:MAG: hypothetical protein K6348_07505 [Deferribacterales bacterium]